MKASLISLFASFLAIAQMTAVAADQKQIKGGSMGRSSIIEQTPAPIPFDQIATVAGKNYSGDGLSLYPAQDGAHLHCTFQRLDARATKQGLWLTSTLNGATGKPFRVLARALGRGTQEPLPSFGNVEVSEKSARFIRTGLTEEYSVNISGLQQDFVIEKRPSGIGTARVVLEVEGATANATSGGACLVLADGGRKLSYNQIKAVDARGKAVKATLEVLSASRMNIVLEDSDAEYPVRIDPTFSDANWVSLGDGPGVNDDVYALVVAGGNLYVGGVFTEAGAYTLNSSFIAEWTGSEWLALGSGMNGRVLALAVPDQSSPVSPSNPLYAGGIFTDAGGGVDMVGGVVATNIAEWNGTSWSALGSGIPGQVLALAVSGGNVYAGGSFTKAGGVAATNIAQWNGSSWLAVGSGVNGNVYALAVSGGNLYAGGYFTAAGAVTIYSIADWNGSSWSALGSGMRFGYVYALLVSGGNLYAGGSFGSAGGVPANNIAEWNGSSWSALGSGVSGASSTVWGLAVSGGNVYAGGSFNKAGGVSATNIAEWNGSSWSALGLGINGIGPDVYALAVSGGNLIAGGYFKTAGSVTPNNIAQWNGTTWSSLGSGLSDLNGVEGLGGYEAIVNVLLVAGGNLYAGGYFNFENGVPGSTAIAEWNGSSWSPVGSGMTGDPSLSANQGEVYALAVPNPTSPISPSNSLYAGGTFTNAGGVSALNIAEWNGTSWSALGSGVGVDYPADNDSVNTLAFSGGNLFAGGSFTNAGGIVVSNIAEWNGSAWSALGSGMNGGVSALAVAGGNLYAGGGFTTAGGVLVSNVAEWDGSVWSAFGKGTWSINGLGALEDGPVLALAVADQSSPVSPSNPLYVGGDFLKAGGTMTGSITANSIAQWNGSSWSALGSGVNATVHALAIDGLGNLYAGGQFTIAGGGFATNIAEWNGSSWSAMGSGTYGPVLTLAASGTSLFAGGAFTEAGTNQSSGAAEVILGAPVIITTNSDFGFNSGQFGFDVSAGALQMLVINSSTDLVNWVPLETNVLHSPILYFSDPSGGSFNNRFYQAELLFP